MEQIFELGTLAIKAYIALSLIGIAVFVWFAYNLFKKW